MDKKGIVISILVLAFSCVCYADNYKKLESLVVKYEKIADSLYYYSQKIKQDKDIDKLKENYNLSYKVFIDTGYYLEEIIIVEGELGIDDLIVPFSGRRESINEIGQRKFDKSVDELIVMVNSNIKYLNAYIKKMELKYGKQK